MIWEHYEAVKALLSGFPMPLYESQVPNEPSYPYGVLRMSTPDEDSTRLCGLSDEATFWVYFTSVAETAEGVYVVADAARSLLLDVRPVVAARSCTRIKKEGFGTAQQDTDVTLPPLNLHPMYAVDAYRFTSYA